jgi:hypothetical protein
MVRTSRAILGAAGGLVAAAGAWSLYQRYSTDSQPHTVVAHVGDTELRRYGPAVLVETTADGERVAFGRLARYIGGANEGERAIAMTTPVEMSDPRRGVSIPMTAPVEVQVGDDAVAPATPASSATEAEAETETDGTDATDADGVRMAFYLPAEYDAESAPRPTEPGVELVAVPERTLAVRRFSWRPTADRVARQRERLLADLERGSVPVSGTPLLMAYDAPGTLPFLRRNEVAVEVDSGPTGR